MLLIILIIVAIYCLEVAWGSCAGAYYPELGFDPEWSEPVRLSAADFWKYLAPLLGLVFGIPLAFDVW